MSENQYTLKKDFQSAIYLGLSQRSLKRCVMIQASIRKPALKLFDYFTS